MKKLAVVLGTLVVLALVAIIVVPLAVDVDKYRPQIVNAANERLNGRLELGKLKLTLWGSIRVQVEGLDLTDAKNRKVLAVKDAFVHVPWSSIFGGAPLLTFHMDKPEVRVVKDTTGALNVTSLMKESEPPAGTAGAPVAAAAPKGTTKIPAIVSNARIGVDVTNALLFYKDETMSSETVTKNLNLRVKDLSLNRETEAEISGLFESSAEKLFKISGPFKVSLHADPRVEGGVFQGLAADFDGDFDDLEIQASQAFHKKKGQTAKFSGQMDLTKETLAIKKLTAKFFNAEIDLSGKVTGLQTAPAVDLSVKSNAISLAPWNELIPMLKDYSLSGTASFDARAEGPVAKLQYAANLAVKDLKAKSPMLKAEPVVNATVKVATDRVEKLTATMSAPGNDLSIEGTVVSFSQPKVDLRIASNSLDLDQLVNFPPPGEERKAGAPATGAGTAGAGKGAPKEDLDALLNPLRKSEVARATTLVATFNAKLMQAYGVRMTDLSAKISMRNLVASIDSFTMKLWDGTVAMKGQTAMLPQSPTYSFSSTVSGLDLSKAVQSRFALFKNTLLGKVNFKIDGSGASYNPDEAKAKLKAKGTLKVTDATFATIDVAKIAGEAINKGLEKVGDKIPGAKGKSIKIPERSSKYEYVASDFSISGGHFTAPNFNAKAMKDQGLDVKGSTDVGMIDQELKADWELIDAWNMTHAKDIGFDVSGVNVPSVLAEGSNPVVIPISIGCKVTAPCPSYQKVPEHFLKVALGNTKKGATAAIKKEGAERAKEAGKKLLKGLFH